MEYASKQHSLVRRGRRSHSRLVSMYREDVVRGKIYSSTFLISTWWCYQYTMCFFCDADYPLRAFSCRSNWSIDSRTSDGGWHVPCSPAPALRCTLSCAVYMWTTDFTAAWFWLILRAETVSHCPWNHTKQKCSTISPAWRATYVGLPQHIPWPQQANLSLDKIQNRTCVYFGR